MTSDAYGLRQQVREFLEANGFGWEEPEHPAAILRSRIATGLGWRDNEIEKCLRNHKFRRLLYCLIDKRSSGPFTIASLIHETGVNKGRLQKYLEMLDFHKLVKHSDERWCVAPEVEVQGFGPSLEWYVAHTFITDLHWQAAWGVYLKDFAHNDFDVVAIRGQRIAVVECKLGNPLHIEDSHIEAFFERHKFLAPDFSLFLVDTESPPQKLAERVNDYVIEWLGQGGEQTRLTNLGSGHVFHIRPSVYVADTNAGGPNGLLRSLQLCLRHNHSIRRVGVWG